MTCFAMRRGRIHVLGVFSLYVQLLCVEERGLAVGVNVLIIVLSEVPDFPRPATMKEVVLNFQM